MPVQNFLKFICMNNNNKHSSSSNGLIKVQCHRSSNSGKMLISAKRNAVSGPSVPWEGGDWLVGAHNELD